MKQLTENGQKYTRLYFHITVTMAEKRWGGKPTDVLIVSLFLFEHSHDERINNMLQERNGKTKREGIWTTT